ncbi:cupin domain-containing protein [Comamonas sp. 26]|uniref:cupin domain-containing protein n=1 Tax=Comamonas sp. 26 TaxID=2035201 RepID=UPI000C1A62CE|nr:cupin domain-containing protein [Comamonas sp. 26]PIG09372.1 acireductone dioxygenase apoprotein [Comamonas sp. 26]
MSNLSAQNIVGAPDPQLLAAVAALGVDWQHRPLQAEPALAALLAQPELDEGGRATVVQALGITLIDVCIAHGYQSMDLVVLHPNTAGLEDALARLDRPHTHGDDEVRFIVDGAGLFGFFDAQGREYRVPVGPGDYLRVPAGTEHRFTLSSARRIKALRLFSDIAGWVAQYTGRPVAPMAMAV